MLLLANYEGRCGVPKAVEMLKARQNGLRAIIEGIKLVEENTDIHTVGQSSWPNILGELQLDAAVMDGNTRRSGAVGAIKGFKHPVEIAYELMERLPYEILVGEGAERFAREIEAVPNINETDASIKAWKKHLSQVLTDEQKKDFPNIRLLDVKSHAVDPEKLFDTTVYLSLDDEERISSATSTAGWAWKYPGRLGDSPIIGAGSYADSRYGACACTHTGEMTIRAGTARSVVLYLKMGFTIKDAVYQAARELGELQTGYLDEVTIHAINSLGEYFVLGVNSSEPIKYVVWNGSMDQPETKKAEKYMTY
ncbi:MAG TPA: asparaginase [Lentisphaeria bacterium]|nr:MAG: asparaginase [Lentisphaerae bacterium GWF2_38_69]HBM16725.1 asparaginase [Lentisphaeria bacterium]